MGPWFFTFLLLFLGLKFLSEEFASLRSTFGVGFQRKLLQRVVSVLQELEETLMAGLVPSQSRWDLIQTLHEPWRSMIGESVKELREWGGSLLPTLRRLRTLAAEHHVALEEARAKSSQAFAQSIACTLLVPLMGASFYFLVPGVEENLTLWLGACLCALLLSAVGAYWLICLAVVARWGGLRGESRDWILSSQCAGERFLALIRTGNPPDLAWLKSLEFLKRETPGLAQVWGCTVWGSGNLNLGLSIARYSISEKVLIEAGESIRKSIQVSLMEGRPCLERVETTLQGLRQDLKSQIERELSLLPTRALKPLFFCVAPALMALLAFGFWLAAGDAIGF